jgi:hypothetical protein
MVAEVLDGPIQPVTKMGIPVDQVVAVLPTIL